MEGRLKSRWTVNIWVFSGSIKFTSLIPGTIGLSWRQGKLPKGRGRIVIVSTSREQLHTELVKGHRWKQNQRKLDERVQQSGGARDPTRNETHHCYWAVPFTGPAMSSSSLSHSCVFFRYQYKSISPRSPPLKETAASLIWTSTSGHPGSSQSLLDYSHGQWLNWPIGDVSLG